MKSELAADVRRYKRRIKADLLCGTKQSKQFMADLSDAIDNYIEENAVARFAEVEEHFGAPEQIARSFLAETDIGVIRKKVRLKQAVLYALLAAIAIWSLAVAWSFAVTRFHQDEYYEIDMGIVSTAPDPSAGGT